MYGMAEVQHVIMVLILSFQQAQKLPVLTNFWLAEVENLTFGVSSLSNLQFWQLLGVARCGYSLKMSPMELQISGTQMKSQCWQHPYFIVAFGFEIALNLLGLNYTFIIVKQT